MLDKKHYYFFPTINMPEHYKNNFTEEIIGKFRLLIIPEDVFSTRS